ncbi:hypothetical protein [Enterovirga rhinocerotis]|uniref:Uncharacterized protein n=1 Tax=Enterovirga rhinocerotis TaxID=1339210 RepID=A0A4R7BZ92_9HYPH|nr:hypothetical protein [Enterovirga rhinocerotis]TDR89537.1 hypothetical protein EV668_2367 [Enterovirga rhinocerotis]
MRATIVILGALLWLATMGIAIMAGLLLNAPRHSGPSAPASPAFDPIAVIGVAVSTQSIVLAMMAFVVAIAAIWGYASIKEVILNKSETTARAVAEKAARDTAASVAIRTVEGMLSSARTEEDYGDAAGDDDARQ